jgi:hypothetical protein
VAALAARSGFGPPQIARVASSPGRALQGGRAAARLRIHALHPAAAGPHVVDRARPTPPRRPPLCARKVERPGLGWGQVMGSAGDLTFSLRSSGHRRGGGGGRLETGLTRMVRARRTHNLIGETLNSSLV